MDRAPVHEKMVRFARSMDRASSFPPPVRLSPAVSSPPPRPQPLSPSSTAQPVPDLFSTVVPDFFPISGELPTPGFRRHSHHRALLLLWQAPILSPQPPPCSTISDTHTIIFPTSGDPPSTTAASFRPLPHAHSHLSHTNLQLPDFWPATLIFSTFSRFSSFSGAGHRKLPALIFYHSPTPRLRLQHRPAPAPPSLHRPLPFPPQPTATTSQQPPAPSASAPFRRRLPCFFASSELLFP